MRESHPAPPAGEGGKVKSKKSGKMTIKSRVSIFLVNIGNFSVTLAEKGCKDCKLLDC